MKASGAAARPWATVSRCLYLPLPMPWPSSASAADTSKPDYITGIMAFMFETPEVIQPTRYALETAQLQHEYYRCWQGLQKHFDPTRP